MKRATTKHISVRQIIAASIALTGLAACGGGSDSGVTAPDPTPDTATFSLAISDAPVDNASEVVVYFDEVELTGNGEPITFDVTDDNGDPRSVDLLTLQGTSFATLVEETEIPVGDYGQLRLVVTEDSYIVMDDGTFPLRVPSNELKLDGFSALPGFEAAYTVEFDLRKSLVDPNGQSAVFLKPRGVRLVLNDDVGVLEGTVDSTLLDAPQCAEKVDLNEGNAVYVYEGEYSEISELGDDADVADGDTEARPYSIIPVTYDDVNETYAFIGGFFPAGDYTLSFSCTALFDEPETDEGEEDGFVLQTIDIVTVTAGDTTTVAID
ncbi:DUF4382 domain-containing protein [Alteromonas sp. CYL-A6]|uniref:DUF4382 domain-containing protein n=1 Tax=Alteromonas nitratireducens TaxID=3390813 RepID=UPI0034B21DED